MTEWRQRDNCLPLSTSANKYNIILTSPSYCHDFNPVNSCIAYEVIYPGTQFEPSPIYTSLDHLTMKTTYSCTISMLQTRVIHSEDFSERRVYLETSSASDYDHIHHSVLSIRRK